MHFYLKDFQTRLSSVYITKGKITAGDALEVKSLCLEHNHEVSQVCSLSGLPSCTFVV